MKTLYLFIAYLLFLSPIIFAQEVHYFNKAITDSNNYNFCLTSFEVDDGFVVLNYEDLLFGGINLNLLKLDKLGNLQWQKKLGEVAYLPPVNTMIQDKGNSDNFLVTYVEEVDTSEHYAISLIKFTKEGGILWKKSYTSTELVVLSSRLIQTNDGGYLIVGLDGYRDTGAMLAIKVDDRGTQEWFRSYPMHKVAQAYFVSQTLDGGYILSGRASTSTNADIYLVKIFEDGSIQWQKTIDVYDGDSGTQAVQLSNGNYLVFATTNHGLEAINYTAVLGAEGEILEENSQTIPCLYSMQTPLLPLDNDEFLGGAMLCNPDIENFFSPYLMRFNSMGDILWTKQFTPSNIIADNAYPRDLKKTSDGGYLMTGHVDFTLGPDAIPYGWIVKMDSLGNTCWELGCDSTVIISNIEEIEAANGLQLSPNPTQNHFNIQMPEYLSSLQFQLTNIEGRVVKKALVVDGQQLEVSDLEAGVYIATWSEEGLVLKREKVVVLK